MAHTSDNQCPRHNCAALGSARMVRGSLVDEVTVVVPGNYLLITQPFAFHRWAKIVFQEVSLVLRGVNT